MKESERLHERWNRLWRWAWFGAKKAWWVSTETVRVLGWTDFLILCISWVITRPLTLLLIALQMVLYGDFPDVWEPPGASRGVVVLIPGYTYTRRQLIALGRRLHHRGFTVVRAKMPPNGNVLNYADTVALNADLLHRVSVVSRERDLPLILVGYSYGGCCAIRMADHLRQLGALPQLVVCVQAPIRGTRLAKFGDHPAAAQLKYEQGEVDRTIDLIDELEGHGTQFAFYCALFDEVTRRRESRPPLRGLRRRWAITLPQFGHWGTFQNPWAINEVVGFINNLINGHRNGNDHP